MAKAIVLREHGGPEALRLETASVGAPASGQLRIVQTAVGVNFHDCYVRSGLYRTLALPGIPGIEAAGVVEEVGADVAGFKRGDRIGYVTGSYGAYASERLLDARLAIPLPAAITNEMAASVLVRGLTVQMLTRAVHRVTAGDRVLVHAAAGGVGRMLCQALKHLGAFVIGTAGSAEKAAVARAAGCDETILYREQDFVAEVAAITEGRGVAVAYDSVGKDTFAGSLACLGVRGHLVNFGQASGPVAPFEVSRLAARSNSVTRPILFHYLADNAERNAMVRALFDALVGGVLTVEGVTRFPLSGVGHAHATLEDRRASGPAILIP